MNRGQPIDMHLYRRTAVPQHRWTNKTGHARDWLELTVGRIDRRWYVHLVGAGIVHARAYDTEQSARVVGEQLRAHYPGRWTVSW